MTMSMLTLSWTLSSHWRSVVMCCDIVDDDINNADDFRPKSSRQQLRRRRQVNDDVHYVTTRLLSRRRHSLLRQCLRRLHRVKVPWPMSPYYLLKLSLSWMSLSSRWRRRPLQQRNDDVDDIKSSTSHHHDDDGVETTMTIRCRWRDVVIAMLAWTTTSTPR